MSQLSKRKVERYLDMAKSASRKSDFPRHKLGAVAIYKGGLLASGANSVKTSPIQKRYNFAREYQVNAEYKHTNCIHAEINCLNKIKFLDIDFSKVTLFVYREHKNGVKGLARPCPACSQMIRDMGIKTVWYTTENGYCMECFD